MEEKYIDFLLVEKQDNSVALVTAESYTVDVGDIVVFNGGKLGRVVKRAWVGKVDCEIHDLISSLLSLHGISVQREK